MLGSHLSRIPPKRKRTCASRWPPHRLHGHVCTLGVFLLHECGCGCAVWQKHRPRADQRRRIMCIPTNSHLPPPLHYPPFRRCSLGTDMLCYPDFGAPLTPSIRVCLHFLNSYREFQYSTPYHTARHISRTHQSELPTRWYLRDFGTVRGFHVLG